MGWRWVQRVFETSVAKGGARLVLLALADRADDAGECFPAAADIARRARLSEGQVRRHIRALCDPKGLAELEIVQPGGGLRPGGERGITNRYRLKLPELPDKPGSPANAGDTCAPALGYETPPPVRKPDPILPPNTRAPTRDTCAPTPKNPSAGAPKPARPRTQSLAPALGEQSLTDSEPSKNQQGTGQRSVGPLARTDAGAVPAVAPGERDFLNLLANARRKNAAAYGQPIGSLLAPPPRSNGESARRIPNSEQDQSRVLLAGIPGLSAIDAADLAKSYSVERVTQAVEALGSRTVRNPGGWLRRAMESGWKREGNGGDA
ncbi:MAG: helix-turn-helix domain-containing protein [Planctomycetes bacterium]|nr:helix-turn-helix domain-containing protein [Planctomycetota bacterium]